MTTICYRWSHSVMGIILAFLAVQQCSAFHVSPHRHPFQLGHSVHSFHETIVPIRYGKSARNIVAWRKEDVILEHTFAPLNDSIEQMDTPSIKSPLMVQREGNHDERISHNKLIVTTLTKLWRHSKTSLSIIFLSLFFFLTINCLVSEAAWAVQSGGRMGGSIGRSSSQSSRSYGRSSAATYSRGYSTPNVVIRPVISTPYYSPFYSPFSWGPSYYPRPSGGIIVNSGPSSIVGIFFSTGVFLLMAVTLLATTNSKFGSATEDSLASSVLGPGVSVAELSVALEVPDRDSPNSILSVLERLSQTARTDNRVGLQNLTSQVALELLRRKQSIVAAYTHAKHYRDGNGGYSKAQREFTALSVKERGKFQRETVSKYGGVDYTSSQPATTPSRSSYSPKATIAVITILLQIDGDSTCNQLSSKVNSISDVEESLSRIAVDSKVDDCLRAVEILWTPEERDETLTMKEVLADYSNLRSV